MSERAGGGAPRHPLRGCALLLRLGAVSPAWCSEIGTVDLSDWQGRFLLEHPIRRRLIWIPMAASTYQIKEEGSNHASGENPQTPLVSHCFFCPPVSGRFSQNRPPKQWRLRLGIASFSRTLVPFDPSKLGSPNPMVVNDPPIGVPQSQWGLLATARVYGVPFGDHFQGVSLG